MALWTTVADPETGEIDAAAWESAVRSQRPVGTCHRCGAEMFGRSREVDFRRVYREVHCRDGHEAVIPGPTYKGRVIPPPGTFAPRHLALVHDE